jgi:hypothetical protein
MNNQERDRNGLMRVYVRRIRPGSSAAEVSVCVFVLKTEGRRQEETETESGVGESEVGRDDRLKERTESWKRDVHANRDPVKKMCSRVKPATG